MDTKVKNKKRKFDAINGKTAATKKHNNPNNGQQKVKRKNRPQKDSSKMNSPVKTNNPNNGQQKVKRKNRPQKDSSKMNSPVKTKNSKLMFDDDGNTISPSSKYRSKNSHHSKYTNDSDVATKWYYELADFNTDGDLVELKDPEILELTKACKSCFEAELSSLQKQNPSDAKWLQTALHKGTSKDRANAGALLVQSNPLANLSALETLIGLSKVSNKTSEVAVDIITELFMSALLTPKRKLLSLPLRGADWKALKKKDNVDQSRKDRALAYWHFEAELKEHYFEFLRNVQAAIQGNQDVQKNQAIICSSKLLMYSPEKEQMLLSMLVNKLGDPSNKVASKALHHLSEVAYKHPAMCEVITQETEKLLFRNNITEHAQHFALCFLSQVAPRGNADVCTRLVQICFSFFKIVVQKGAVNSKTMQAILRCLKRAIVDAKTDTVGADGEPQGILTKDIQDTMYRLVHLADIHITLQTLALLLQIMTVRAGNYDRFYNALYKKMLDINLVNVGPKAAAQFLHIIHRAIYMDANTPRAQAFIKRLLQVAFYFPAQITCGCLIVINKLMKSRPELGKTVASVGNSDGQTLLAQNEGENEESDAEEHYKDVSDEVNEVEEKVDAPVDSSTTTSSSWHHAKVTTTGNDGHKVSQISSTKYNPFHRVPAYAGAEYALKTELLQLVRHFHPTVQVFAQSIIDSKHINFYGDPLRDFCLTQFLERFSFRNPKKLDDKKPGAESLVQAVHHRTYKAFGGRGMPVQNLTKSNCTEDERFIFQYLEQKREKRAAFKKASGRDDDEESVGSVDDNEFDAYLDKLGGGDKNDVDDDDLDFLADLGDELKEDEGKDKKKSKKKRKADEDDDEEGDGDWDFNEGGDEDVEADDNEQGDDGLDEDMDDADSDGSVSLDGEDDDDNGSEIFENDSDEEAGSEIFDASDDDGAGSEIFDDSDDDDAPKSKKPRRSVSEKEFSRKLKNTDDMSSLFAAADDFSEMLEETSKSKTHGTLGDLFNKDKSSEKQLAWEQKRFKASGTGGGGGGYAKPNSKHYSGHKYRGNKNHKQNLTHKKRKY